jgi:hypothetical protein
MAKKQAAPERTMFEKESWADKHFPPVDEAADDVELEQKLRTVCMKGARYIDGVANGTRWTLSRIRPPSKYVRYFTNLAKLESVGGEKFEMIASRGGVEYTNEYQYATLLKDKVDAEVVKKSVELVLQYTRDPAIKSI